MELIDILTIALIFLVFVIIILAFVYLRMASKSKREKEQEISAGTKEGEKKTTKKGGQYTKLSVFDFMEFDKIQDNMIVQDNGKRYLMAIECEGINYDLMSDVEKIAVEEGFIQFLNTLRHPIQLYTQTRTVNISTSLENYNKRVELIGDALTQKQAQYNRMIQSGTYEKKDLEDLRMELARQQNLYEYSVDIVSNIEKVSLNKNVLRKHYYIIIPYYTSELGNDMLDEEEKRSMVFSELYTRAQSIIRTLFACSMKCRVMNSNDLAELLYVAYNRDESEIYGIEKALNSGFAELYSTAPDVIDKKMEALDKKINQEAMNLAVETVDLIKSEKQKKLEKKEKNFDDLVKELAQVIIKENSAYVGPVVANKAIKRIQQEDTKDEEVDDSVKKEKAKTRRTKRVS